MYVKIYVTNYNIHFNILSIYNLFEVIQIMANLRGEDGHKVFSIRIEDALCEKLEKLSKKTGISRNRLIAELLEQAINDHEETLTGCERSTADQLSEAISALSLEQRKCLLEFLRSLSPR